MIRLKRYNYEVILVNTAIKSGFDKLFWGFLFVMVDFRLQGIDILPDVIGYIPFAVGFNLLGEYSIHFKKAGTYNMIMIIVSIFQIYEQPAQGGGININPFSMLVGSVSLLFGLVVGYYLFVGIKDMAQNQAKMDIYEEAGKKWTQYFVLHLAAFFAFVLIFIPPLAFVYIMVLFLIAIILTFIFMGFMKRCGENLS
jgi:hypothetical protein